MGFRIELDKKSDELVRLVQSDPSRVFGRLYSAYMLFLIGEPDQNELKWLLDHAKSLDSLTGDHIAYAVFAKQFQIRLRTYRPDETSRRSPMVLGELNL